MIFVARLLGPQQYGEYTIVMVPVGIAILLMDPGVNLAITRQIARYQALGEDTARKAAQTTGYTINTLIATVFTLAIFLLSSPISTIFLHRPDLESLVRIASLSILGQALVNSSNAIFIGHHRMELQSAISILFAVTKGLTMPLLVYFGFGLGGAILGHTLSILVTGIVGTALTLAFIKLNTGGFAYRLDIEEARRLFSFGIPIFLSTLLGGLLNQLYSSLMVIYVAIDQTGIDLVGNYSAALNFAVLVSFITTPLVTTLFPLFSKLDRNSPNLKHAYQNSVKYSSLVALPAALGLITVADAITRIVYGVNYPHAAYFLGLYLLVYLSIGVGGLCTGSLLNGLGETRIVLKTSLLTFIVGAPLSLLLIPTYGIDGLIASTIIAPLPSLAYGLYWIGKNLGFSVEWRSSATIYLSSLGAIMPVLLITATIHLTPWPRLVTGGLLYLATYILLIKLTKTLNHRDYQMFRSMVGDAGLLASTLNKIIDIFEKS